MSVVAESLEYLWYSFYGLIAGWGLTTTLFAVVVAVLFFKVLRLEAKVQTLENRLVHAERDYNLTLAKLIAKVQGKELNYQMNDFHSARPGHDLRYALDGGLLKSLGWEPSIKLSERINDMTQWTLANDRWLGK